MRNAGSDLGWGSRKSNSRRTNRKQNFLSFPLFLLLCLDKGIGPVKFS